MVSRKFGVSERFLGGVKLIRRVGRRYTERVASASSNSNVSESAGPILPDGSIAVDIVHRDAEDDVSQPTRTRIPGKRVDPLVLGGLD